jgi:peptide/nickel transport system ATP-binding protein
VSTPDVLLAVEGLSVQFATEHGWTTVVEDVSFEVRRHDALGIVGESGSGKSVTAMSILRLLPTPPARFTSGRILLDGVDLLRASEPALNRIRGNEIAMIFQEPLTSLNPAFTVGEQVAEVVRRHRHVSRREAWARAVEMLDKVGIPSAARRADDYPHSFSGGMRQRAMIAAALACDPKLLIADEPTTALDVTVQALVLDLLSELRAELDMALILITHDLGVIADVCERALVMYAGQIVEESPIVPLFDAPSHPYTEGLLRSIPTIGAEKGALWSIPGVVPPPWAMPGGCRFHPRCDYAAAPGCTTRPIPLAGDGVRRTRCARSGELALQGVEP